MKHEIQDMDKPINQDMPSQEKILYKEECYAIQGAVFEVYREMGCGFLNAFIKNALQKSWPPGIFHSLTRPSCLCLTKAKN